jgi:hypothetical protein
MSSKEPPSDDEKLARYEQAYAELRRQLADLGFLWVGTVMRQYHQCRHPSCRCRRGGRYRHGPYYVWTRKIKGKTVTRMLAEQEGRLYTTWIRNRRKLDRTIRRMQAISRRAAPLLINRAKRR